MSRGGANASLRVASVLRSIAAVMRIMSQGRDRSVKWQGIVLSVLFLGLMSFLGAVGIELLVWIVLVPLIILALKGSFRDIFVFGSVAILLAGMFCLSWIALYSVRTLLLSLFSWYLFFMFFVLATRLLNKTTGCLILIPPVVWFCGAQIASFTIVGSAWTDLAMFQPTMAPLIWVVGARGITFLIVLVNTVIASLCLRRSREMLVVGSVLLLIIIGCVTYSNLAEPEGKNLKVALLQGNFAQPWIWRCDHAETVVLETYLEMTREAAQEKPDIIVWPEYAIPADVFRNTSLLEKISATVKKSGSCLVFGTLILHERTNGKRVENDVAVVISSDGAYVDKYVSVRPVPYETWTLPGDDLHVVNTEKARLGILLCFEETIADIARDLTLQGAKLFISLANNSRFKQTCGVYLASLQTRLRAAENRRYLVRATNTGITQVINPYGKIIAAVKPFERKIITTEVRLSDQKTFYSKYGDLTIILFILAVCCSVSILSIRGNKLLRYDKK